jgi:Protein kinase domain
MADTRLGTELAGYRIESLLGRGGMSVVYLAEDLRLKRKAALKILAPELAMDASFRERFIAESELAASLDHPNVIPIFEAGEADGSLFIAMRYVKSTDLKALIRREGRLDPERALSIVGQTASALDAAHAMGLVHRDVKPANILVAEGQGPGGTDHVYLADFGLTKRSRQRTGITRTGQFVGTVDYVAPEQIEGKEIDGRTDEYAMACVLYECLVGDSPYPKDDETAVLIAHLMDPVPSIRAVRPDLPAAFDEVLRAGMAKRKEARFPDCTALVRAASDALAGKRSVTQLAPPPAAPAPAAPVPVAAGTGAGVGTFQPAPGTFEPAPGTFQPAEGPPAGQGGGPRRGGGRRRWLTAVAAAVAAAVVAAGLVLVLGKGGGGGGGGATGTPTTFPSARSFAPGTVIYTDAFSDNSGRWDQADQPNFRVGIEGGRYAERIEQTTSPQTFAASFPRVPRLAVLGDVSVRVEATKLAGPLPDGAGIACRTNGNTLSYYFVIGSNGGWAIEKSDGVHQPQLASGTSPFIVKGEGQPNTIRGDCVGGTGGSAVTLTMYVNGNRVGSVQDTPAVDVPGDSPGVYPTGTAGLVAVGNKGFAVAFDRFEVVAAGG